MSDRDSFDPSTTCNDCGSCPVWRWRSHGQPNYCERCLDKAGHSVSVSIPISELAGVVGDATTVRVLRAVGHFDANEVVKES